ncbi:substrate-binding domain-containing protein, partial [Shewanella sp. A25]|nr:substrate-binding domain-containing protein [Shewanella shenzhenensis]
LSLPPERVAKSTANMEGGEQAVKELLARGETFTALLAYNDLMAIGAIHALFAAGIRVPEDVSVVGFDDLPVARACRPRLTTMHYPIEEMAAYAVNLAIKLSNANCQPTGQTYLF